MLNTMGHDMAVANGGSRESKHQTIHEHQERIISGQDYKKISSEAKEESKK